MMTKPIDTIFEDFLCIKNESQLQMYDVHTHPLDVLGIVDASYQANGDNEKRKANPSLLEKLDYNNLSLCILDMLFLYFPKYIKKKVRESFPVRSVSVLQAGMVRAGIDKAILIPVEPAVQTESMLSYVNSNQFLRLGSVDIHNTEIDALEQNLIYQKQNFSIVGIKLHPNLQRFYPYPYLNPPILKNKLLELYKLLNKHNLYTHFHAGSSYVTQRNGFSKVDFAVLENFFDKEKINSTFDLLRTPTIIAHLGSYNIKKPNYSLLSDITTRYRAVYFDTAAISSKILKIFILENGIENLIFGSDALYFNLRYAIDNILGLIHSIDHKCFKENVIKIFNKNYLDGVLKQIQ